MSTSASGQLRHSTSYRQQVYPPDDGDSKPESSVANRGSVDVVPEESESLDASSSQDNVARHYSDYDKKVASFQGLARREPRDDDDDDDSDDREDNAENLYVVRVPEERSDGPASRANEKKMAKRSDPGASDPGAIPVNSKNLEGNKQPTLGHFGPRDPETATDQARFGIPGLTAGSEELVHASMVDVKKSKVVDDIDPDFDPEKEMTTVRAKEYEHKPWYKRKYVVLGLIVSALAIVGIAVGVSVGMSNKNNGSTDTTTTKTMSDLTLVMLMDYQPEQVGWRLECDNQVIHDIPTGTYGLLGYGVSGVAKRRQLHRHGGALIDSFRVEYTTQVPYGSTCIFNITDEGGDGLINGFYEVYYGNDVGITENLIEQVAFEAFFHISQFVAQEPGHENQGSTETTPLDEGANCTVCPGGEAVPDPSVELDSGRTCGELDDIFAETFSDCPREPDLIHDCGCLNQCDKLCRDGSVVSQDFTDKLVKVENGRPVTCSMAQEQVARRTSSTSDCLRSNYLGETFCGCPKEEDFCHLCQDEKTPRNLTLEIVPGVTCESLSGIGYSLKVPDERFGPICPACQGLGAYCGCPQEEETDTSYCRLCGGNNLLPELGRTVFFPLLNFTTTCIHVEFQANVNSTEIAGCAKFQEDFGDHCCG